MEENCGLSVEINKRLLNKPDATVDAVLKVMLMKLYKFTYFLEEFCLKCSVLSDIPISHCNHLSMGSKQVNQTSSITS